MISKNLSFVDNEGMVWASMVENNGGYDIVDCLGILERGNINE